MGINNALSLCEIPTVVLSKTWFGDTMSGESCYSLKSRAVRDLSSITPAGRAVCPVRVFNATASEMELQRMCIHVEHLGIFRTGKRLWTNQVEINYRGDERSSQISYSSPPEVEGKYDKIADPRVKPERNILKKSIRVMKMLTVWEGM